MNKKRGAAALNIIFITLFCMIIISLTIQYIGSIVMVRNVEEKINQAVIDSVTKNWENVYSSIREGYSAAFVIDESSQIFKELYDVEAVNARIQNHLDLNGNKKLSPSGKILYTIKNLNVKISNVNFKNNTLDFLISIKAKVELPFNFFALNSSIDIDLKSNSKYSKKF